MPGPFIHMAVAEAVRTRLQRLEDWPRTGGLPQLAGLSPKLLAKVAADHDNYYALGAIGPDLFFLLTDFRSLCIGGKRVPIADPLTKVVETIDDLYDKLDAWFLEDWERYIGPISENLDEALSRLTGDLSTVVSTIMGDLSAILFTALVDLASQSRDWFGFFSLGLNKGFDDQDFFWSDMLHYRKTSRFPFALLEIATEEEAKGDDDTATADEHKARAARLRAYALGYITHISTDVTAHPFVNEKCGGPYRTHWQRHHLIENHMDAQVYDDLHGSDTLYNMLTESALHYRIAFDEHDASKPAPARPAYTPGDDSLRGLYVRRRHLDLDSKMPDELADFIFGALEKAYNTSAAADLYGAAESSPRILPGNDGRPDAEAIKTAYLMWFRYLKHATLDGFAHEKPMPPSVFPNLDFPQLTDPHDDPPSAGDEDMSFWDWLLAILRFLLWIVEVAVWLATILPTIIADLGTYPFRVIAYYAIELPLYYLLKAERMVLVMTGYALPMKDEIELGLVRLCTGHSDAFLAVLHDLDDELAGLEDAALAVLEGKFNELSGSGLLSPDQLVAKLLGDLDVQASAPVEPIPDPLYPHQHELDPMGEPIEYHHPWDYPMTNAEIATTVAGPYACGDMPRVLVDGGIQGNQAIRNQYERAQRPGDTDAISRQQLTRQRNLGDPVNFGNYLMWQLTRDDFPKNADNTRVVDWNLDADRGYAYKCWDWNRHMERPKGDPHDVAHHVLLDADGHEFLEPCTPPPQADKAGTKGCGPAPLVGPDPSRALELHFTDQADPGCRK